MVCADLEVRGINLGLAQVSRGPALRAGVQSLSAFAQVYGVLCASVLAWDQAGQPAGAQDIDGCLPAVTRVLLMFIFTTPKSIP